MHPDLGIMGEQCSVRVPHCWHVTEQYLFSSYFSLMFQTDKSMVELELDLNQKFGEWVALQEAGSQLKPLYGPGYTGLINLGNSCYMNSIIQVIFVIPDFVRRWEKYLCRQLAAIS